MWKAVSAYPCLRPSHLCRCVVDDLLGGQVGLVADEELVHVLSGIAVNLLQPLLDVVE